MSAKIWTVVGVLFPTWVHGTNPLFPPLFPHIKLYITCIRKKLLRHLEKKKSMTFICSKYSQTSLKRPLKKNTKNFISILIIVYAGQK